MDLQYTPLRDGQLCFLTGCAQLRFINLAHTWVTSIAPLVAPGCGLSLESVDVSFTGVVDIPLLAQCPSLRQLVAAGLNNEVGIDLRNLRNFRYALFVYNFGLVWLIDCLQDDISAA